MTTRTTTLHSGPRTTVLFGASAFLVAMLIGVLSAKSPTYAVAGLVGLVALPAAIFRPKLVTYVLVATIWTQATTVGGVTVGRLAAPLALVAILSQLTNSRTRLSESRSVLTAVGVYLFLAIASMGWSISIGATGVAVSSLAIALTYMAAFAVLVRDEIDLRRLLWAIATFSVLLALVWISRYTHGVDRRYNDAGDPNFFAALQVVALPLVLALTAQQRSAGRRALLYGAIIIISASIVSTLSRGGLITVGVAMALMACLPYRVLFRTKMQKYASLGSILIGLMVLLSLAWSDLTQRLQEGAKTNVLGPRHDLWLAAFRAWREHQWTGIGFGAFHGTSFHLLSITPGVDLAAHLRFLDTGEYVHNTYLGMLTEMGPLGLLSFVAVLFFAGRALVRTARHASQEGHPLVRSTSMALVVGLVGVAVSAALLSAETDRALWMIVGMSLCLPDLLPQPALPAVDLLRTPPALRPSEGPN